MRPIRSSIVNKCDQNLDISLGQEVTYQRSFSMTYNSLMLYGRLKHGNSIKTHDSESRGQEEAGRTRRMSVLFTGNTAVKLVNALNKPP